MSGVFAPVGGVYVGNLSIWLFANYLGTQVAPPWLGGLNIAAVLVLVAILGWTLGSLPKLSQESTFWIDLSVFSLLIFFLVFKTVNEQYVVWLVPFLSLDVALGRERMRTIVGFSALALTYSWVNLGGSSFFLPLLTISSSLGPWTPFTWDLPSVRAALAVIFWLLALMVFRARVLRKGGFRKIVDVFVSNAKLMFVRARAIFYRRRLLGRRA